MPSRRKGPSSDPIARSRELDDQSRNEQQKAIFLSEVASMRGGSKCVELRRQSGELVQESQKLRQVSRALRSKRSV
jgi:hypothetical protein